MPKLQENVKVLESQSEDTKSKFYAVLSSVIIAYVFTNYHINLKSEHYEVLLSCLKLPPDEEICAELLKKINKFDHDTLRYMYM